jgi:hypothetical protein
LVACAAATAGAAACMIASSCAAEIGGSCPEPACDPPPPLPPGVVSASGGGTYDPDPLPPAVGMVNVRSTLANRSAESNRFSGSLEHACSIAAHSREEMSGLHRRRSGSGALMCCFITSRALVPA